MSYFPEGKTIVKNIYFISSSCCAPEMNNLFTTKYDIQRLGFKRTDKITQADVIILCGHTSKKSLKIISNECSRRSKKPLIIALGGCAIDKGPLNADETRLPISLYVPGCPPRPESILDALYRGLKNS
jgi:NADH-quinone oxidoreductase subunit B